MLCGQTHSSAVVLLSFSFCSCNFLLYFHSWVLSLLNWIFFFYYKKRSLIFTGENSWIGGWGFTLDWIFVLMNIWLDAAGSEVNTPSLLPRKQQDFSLMSTEAFRRIGFCICLFFRKSFNNLLCSPQTKYSNTVDIKTFYLQNQTEKICFSS